MEKKKIITTKALPGGGGPAVKTTRIFNCRDLLVQLYFFNGDKLSRPETVWPAQFSSECG